MFFSFKRSILVLIVLAASVASLSSNSKTVSKDKI